MLRSIEHSFARSDVNLLPKSHQLTAVKLHRQGHKQGARIAYSTL